MNSERVGRHRATKVFLWLAVFGWAIALGAKLFDLLVLGCAWGASPPASLELLPYGKAYPINPGNFFQPLSAVMLLGTLGALIAGWKSPARSFLWVAIASFAVIWILTPTVFWPMINDLWALHRGRLSLGDAEMVGLVRRWFIWDSLRIGLVVIGFVASVRAHTVANRTVSVAV